jgi:hypothetical protein
MQIWAVSRWFKLLQKSSWQNDIAAKDLAEQLKRAIQILLQHYKNYADRPHTRDEAIRRIQHFRRWYSFDVSEDWSNSKLSSDLEECLSQWEKYMQSGITAKIFNADLQSSTLAAINAAISKSIERLTVPFNLHLSKRYHWIDVCQANTVLFTQVMVGDIDLRQVFYSPITS